jgi:hypothetical protein
VAPVEVKVEIDEDAPAKQDEIDEKIPDEISEAYSSVKSDSPLSKPLK